MEYASGKWWGRMFVTAIFASLLLMVIGWLYTMVVDASVAWGAIVGLVLAFFILMVALKMHPGKEAFFDFFPLLLFVSAIVGGIAQVWVDSPLQFVVEMSLQGLALAFSAILFASTLSNKVVK